MSERIWHSTGPKPSHGHWRSSCPGASCPVVAAGIDTAPGTPRTNVTRIILEAPDDCDAATLVGILHDALRTHARAWNYVDFRGPIPMTVENTWSDPDTHPLDPRTVHHERL